MTLLCMDARRRSHCWHHCHCTGSTAELAHSETAAWPRGTPTAVGHPAAHSTHAAVPRKPCIQKYRYSSREHNIMRTTCTRCQGGCARDCVFLFHRDSLGGMAGDGDGGRAGTEVRAVGQLHRPSLWQARGGWPVFGRRAKPCPLSTSATTTTTPLEQSFLNRQARRRKRDV